MNLLRRRMMELPHKQDVDIPIGVNLLTVYGAISGKSLTVNGTFANWASGTVSQYIPCSPSFLFELKTSVNQWNKLAFYDSEKAFIPPTNSLGGYNAGTFQFGVGTEFNIPENASYFVVQVSNDLEVDYIKRMK